MEKNPLMTTFILHLIRFYQRYISPLRPATCRFHPTCSEYMVKSIQISGLVTGGFKGIKQLCRCHPYTNTKEE